MSEWKLLFQDNVYMENIMNSDDDEKGTNMVLLSGLKKFWS